MPVPNSELKAALLSARTRPEILTALARIEYRRMHPGKDCPPDKVPDERTLLEGLPQCPTEVQAEARKAAQAMREAREAGEPPSHPDPEPLLTFFDSRDPPQIHRRWLDLPEPRPDHPVAPFVRAWQNRPKEVEPDRHDNAIMQIGLFREAPAGVWSMLERETEPLETGPVPEPEPQLMLFGEDANEPVHSPLLTLVGAAGFATLQQGRGARLDKRILIFGLLTVPREQRRAGGRWELREEGWRIVEQLWKPNEHGRSSYRRGKHGRALTEAFDALSLAKVRLADGALWRPAVTRQSPNPRDLDTKYIIEFRFPDDCDRGAMVHRPSLIADGMVSDPAFDLCLSLAYLWDEAKARNGGFRVYATRPKAKRDRDGNLLDREGHPIMGAPGSPRTGRDGKPTWPRKDRNGERAPMKNWRHPNAVLNGTERHPAADKVRALGPDERRTLAFGDTRRRDRRQRSKDREKADTLLLRLEAEGRIAIESPRDKNGIPLSRFKWRILEAPRPTR